MLTGSRVARKGGRHPAAIGPLNRPMPRSGMGSVPMLRHRARAGRGTEIPAPHPPRATQARGPALAHPCARPPPRSEAHTSELQSLMRISYAVFSLHKTTKHILKYIKL